MKAFYNWIGKHINAPYGTFIFCLLTFIEGFFIIPVSTLLAFYCLENRKKSFLYGTAATISSGFGALAGYFIGFLIWKGIGTNILNFFISPEKFNYAVEQYKTYQAWAVFLTAFTPVPFKALTITAGFCQLPIIPFLIFTLLARGIRFYFIAIGIYIWGEQVNYYFKKYFYYIVIFAIGFLILLIWLIH